MDIDTVPAGRAELATHGVIAGIVTVTIAAVEIGTHSWLSDRLGSAFLPLVLGGAFVLAFCAIYLLQRTLEGHIRRLRTRHALAPIELDALGCIDGEWMDAMWFEDEARPSQGSLLTIRSARHAGFAIEGRTYAAHSVVEPVGSFSTTKTLCRDHVVLYHYEGHEGRQRPDAGVGYYAFWRDDQGDLRFDGAFLALSLQRRGLRYVQGRRLSAAQAQGDRREALKAYLKSLQSPQSAPAGTAEEGPLSPAAPSA